MVRGDDNAMKSLTFRSQNNRLVLLGTPTSMTVWIVWEIVVMAERRQMLRNLAKLLPSAAA